MKSGDKDRTAPPPPTLDHMLYEHDVVLGLVVLAQKRIERGVRMPGYLWKTVYNLAEAYLMTVQEFFPRRMREQYKEVEEQLDKVIEMYHGPEAEQAVG